MYVYIYIFIYIYIYIYIFIYPELLGKDLAEYDLLGRKVGDEGQPSGMVGFPRTVDKHGNTFRYILAPPSLLRFATQGLLPSVAGLKCGFSLPVCGFVRTFD